MKTIFSRLAPFVSIILLAITLLSACAAEEHPRLVSVPTYNPGAVFQTNFNDEDMYPRRQIKCSIIFEVIDDLAVTELEERNYKVRDSVLTVLSELSIDEVAFNRDLDHIREKIVEKVNEDLNATGGINLIVRAYFTEFAIV